ncbi:MAG: hypothetical protein DRI48_05935 [Chloroflexi bacterium]|nr:MAG: hypothetical protein DRI48_05935 [Chloroflexota bacterium]
MHVLAFAQFPDVVEKIQPILSDVVDRCTIATTWSDVLSSVEEDCPDLILIERMALGRVDFTTLLNLMEPDRWPPLLLVDTLVSPADGGIALTRRLSRPSSPLYQVGDLRVDTRRKRVGLGERWVTLPPLQYRLLLTLVRRSGEVVDYRELFKAVWGYDGDESEARELLKVHVRQIRRRLSLDAEEQPYIHSVRGFGYMVVPPEEEAGEEEAA